MFLLALGCMLGVTFDNVAGDERTARRLRRTGDDEADGENVYSSASRTYTPGDFDEPPDTETYICTRAGVDSIDQARFKNLAKMEASGEAFHKNNAVLADAMRVAIGKNRPIINYLASKNVDYSDCHDGGLLFLHACGTMPVAVEGGEPNATDSYTDDKHDLRRPGLNWSQIGASAAVACLATIVTMHIANGIT